MASRISQSLSRFFGTQTDPREELRPLWHHVIGLSRDEAWYRDCGVADSVSGRFDMIANVTALVVLRMEESTELRRKTAYLIELFVEDMDGQLREFGVGDVVVGKHVGKLMGTLGGRVGAFRKAVHKRAESALNDAEMGSDDANATSATVKRNTTMADETKAAVLTERMMELAATMMATSDEGVLAGRFAL